MTAAEPDAVLGARSLAEHELASVSGPANPTLTEMVEIDGHGHALTIDGGWRESPAPPWPSSSASSR
jgi:hypothetical protein